MTQVVVLELNELSIPLLDRFIGEGRLPGFARFRDEATRYVTDAEETGARLNPWVQWVTVHTGLGVDDHEIRSLGRGHELRVPTIGDRLAAAGRSVWLCSPMNVVPQDPSRLLFLPDPWAIDAAPSDPSLEPFYRFVRANVQEHANPDVTTSRPDAARFVVSALRHGLRARTIRASLRQLNTERRRPQERWRRASVLDHIAWDLFLHELDRHRPDFATFFANSTAHLQHHYWRFMEPELFDGKVSTAAGGLADAIRTGYEQLDEIVVEAIERLGQQATLVFCTALSQAANVGPDADTGAVHRAYDLNELLDVFGVDGVTKASPVMSGQFRLHFGDDTSAAAAVEVLLSARMDGAQVMEANRTGSEILSGCILLGDVPPDGLIDVAATGRTARFGDIFFSTETGMSGSHQPDGMFWIRPAGGGEGVDAGRISLRQVAPTLLQLAGVPVPEALAAPVTVG